MIWGYHYFRKHPFWPDRQHLAGPDLVRFANKVWTEAVLVNHQSDIRWDTLSKLHSRMTFANAIETWLLLTQTCCRLQVVSWLFDLDLLVWCLEKIWKMPQKWCFFYGNLPLVESVNQIIFNISKFLLFNGWENVDFIKGWIKGQLGVPLTVSPWYLLCFLGILGGLQPIDIHQYKA